MRRRLNVLSGLAAEIQAQIFEHAAEVCEPDIETLCSDVEAGEGRIASCMLKQKASAGPQCQEAINAFEGKLQ